MKRKKNINCRHFWPLVLLIGLAIGTHPAWFLKNGILTHGDWWFDFSEKIMSLFSWPTIWSAESGLGGLNVGLSFWPYQVLSGFLAKFGADYAFMERFLYFWPAALLLVVSPYFLVTWLTGSRWGGFFAALVYAFNAPLIVGETGIMTLVLAISIVPLVIYFFLRSLETDKVGFAIGSGLAGIWLCVADFRVYYQLAGCLVLLAAYFLLFVYRPKDWRGWRRGFLFLAISLLLPLAANLYWFIALRQTASFSGHDVFNRALFGEWLVNISQGLTLFPYLWTGSKPVAFVVRPISFYFYLIPIYAFSSLILHRGEKLKKVIIFTIIALVGIFLVKQSGRPFTNVYRWLFDNLPGFSVFRESTKFYLLISLGYAVMIGFTAQKIVELYQSRKSRWPRLISGGLLVILSLVFLVNTSSMISGRMETLFVERSIPSDYLVWQDFIKSQPDYFRTLWVPRFSRWSAYDLVHPRLNMTDLIFNTWRSFLVPSYSGAEPEYSYFANFFNFEIAHGLLSQAGIRYVAVPLADEENDDNFFSDYDIERQSLIDSLDKVEWLERVDLGTVELAIWRVNDSQTKFFAVGDVLLFGGSPFQFSLYRQTVGQAQKEQADVKEKVVIFSAADAAGLGDNTDLCLAISKIGPDQLTAELPYARFLPGNPFYSLIRLKENFLLWITKNQEKRLDLELKFAAKRLGEVLKAYDLLYESQLDFLLKRTMLSETKRQTIFLESLRDYQDQLEILRAELENNNAVFGEANQVLSGSLLREQRRFLSWFFWELSHLKIMPDVSAETLQSLRKLEGFMDQYLVIDEEETDRAITIPKSGFYSVRNENETMVIENLFLEKGPVSYNDLFGSLVELGWSQNSAQSASFICLTKDRQTEEDPLEVKWEMIRPTRYRVTVTGKQNSFWLFFGERFSPDWKISRIGQEGEEFSSSHYETSGWANGWLIEKNTNSGSSPLTAIIEFKPQRGLELGLAATGAFFVIGAIVFLIGEKWSKKR